MRKRSTETVLYGFGIGAAVCIAALFLVLHYVPELDRLSYTWVCPFRRLTGFYCPGCGGTRAVRALLRGDLLQSFRYHAGVPTGGLIYVAFMGTQTVSRLSGGRIPGLRWRNVYLWVWIGAVLLNWFVKNLGILLQVP